MVHLKRVKILLSPLSGQFIQAPRWKFHVVIKWMVHPRMVENRVHPIRTEILYSPQGGRFIQDGWKLYLIHKMNDSLLEDQNVTDENFVHKVDGPSKKGGNFKSP